MSVSTKSLVIKPGGIEFIKWRTRGMPAFVPAGSVKVSLDGGTVWHEADVIGDEIRLLVAHPDAVNPGDAVMLPQGRSNFLVQLTDIPEVVIRAGGSIWA